MSVKITELPILDSLADNDIVAGVDVSGNVTSKIEMSTLKNYIDTNTQYTAGTNIDITNNVISAPDVYNKDEMDNQIEELQNEVDSLSTIFNAFPTESGEGESLTLDDTAEVKFKKFELEGNTSQTTYSGINLFQMPSSATSNGITYKLNDDGTFNISGTSTAQANFTKVVDVDKANLTNGETYTLYFNALLNFYAMVAFYNGDTWLSTPLTLSPNARISSTTLTIPSNCNKIQFVFRIGNGVTVNQTNAYCMLVKGSYTSTNLPSFEPYVGGTTSPNPDYPQDVHVVSGDNEINVCGKNLFTLKNISNGTPLGIEKTINNSELKLNGTSSGAGNIIFRRTTGITLGAGTYSILVQRKSGTIIANSKQSAFYFRKPNGTEITAFSYNNFSNSTYSFKTSFVLSEPTELYVEIFCNGSGYVFTDLELQFQIEKGYNASPVYEPYQGNTYNIDLPVENLLPISSLASTTSNGITFTNNNDGTYTLNGTATAEATFYIFGGNTEIKANSKLTFSCKELIEGTRIFWYDNWAIISGAEQRIGSGKPNYTTTNEITTISQLRVNISVVSGTTVNNLTIKPMLEKGSKANSYTPYGTTPIELCKIGNYQDYFYKDSGKWYLHKEIGKVVLNGSESWQVHGSIASWFYCDDVTDGYFDNARSDYALCNYFTQNSYSNVVDITNGQFVYGTPGGTTKRLVLKDTDYTTVADFKTWLSTHNVTLYYVLSTPVNTALEDM